ncbi:MAG: DUF4150 domain-containing protein [Ancalomicrobiaceae bacterium]|nr:DUF4150 domain-containing protein [Ancalomicrobiaceae bacterium]
MFANTNLGVMNFAFPDVCLTPIVVPVPIPYPNFALSFTHIPSQFNVLIGGGLAENIATSGTISMGDNAGVNLGVMSGLEMGPDRPIMGSTNAFIGGPPATKLTSPMMQNGTNAFGMSLTPSQVTVILLR